MVNSPTQTQPEIKLLWKSSPSENEQIHENIVCNPLKVKSYIFKRLICCNTEAAAVETLNGVELC